MGAVASRRTRGPIDNISFSCGALSGLSQNNHSLVFRIDPITCFPNSVNDMACCITSFKPLIDLGSTVYGLDSSNVCSLRFGQF